ncbi:MAG: hypothetical protein ABIH23_21405, partial [bacterium]
TAEKLDNLFLKWKEQPLRHQVPNCLTGETRSYWTFETLIMGVRYVVKAKNALGPVTFSENLLGIIEAALVLAKWENFAFVVDEVEFLVKTDRAGSNPPEAILKGPSVSGSYDLCWKPDMLDWLYSEERSAVGECFLQLLLRILLEITIDPLSDLMDELEKWKEQGTFNRAIELSPTSVFIMEILGTEKYEINYWYGTSTS